jgi:hypothetical protein
MIDGCPVGATDKTFRFNLECGSINHSMLTERMQRQDVAEKRLFGCLVTKFKELHKEDTQSRIYVRVVLTKKDIC